MVQAHIPAQEAETGGLFLESKPRIDSKALAQNTHVQRLRLTSVLAVDLILISANQGLLSFKMFSLMSLFSLNK